ncbi:hypothetical protein ABF638_37170 [Nostoc sp. CALU 1950]
MRLDKKRLMPVIKLTYLRSLLLAKTVRVCQSRMPVNPIRFS